ELGQGWQLAGGGRPRALAREGAHVQLVEHLARQGETAPVRVAPGERARIDHARGAVRPVGLEARGRIGQQLLTTVEAIAIEQPGPGIRDLAREVTVVLTG